MAIHLFKIERLVVKQDTKVNAAREDKSLVNKIDKSQKRREKKRVVFYAFFDRPRKVGVKKFSPSEQNLFPLGKHFFEFLKFSIHVAFLTSPATKYITFGSVFDQFSFIRF